MDARLPTARRKASAVLRVPLSSSGSFEPVVGSSVRVLVVDDDAALQTALSKGLGLEGLTVEAVASGEAALRAVERAAPDAIVLDVGMPGMSGIEVVRRLRLDGSTIPVCILSARDEVDDRVAGLAAGADDYMVKPFSLAELAARVTALVRLHAVRRQRPLEIGDLVIDGESRSASRGGRSLGLTLREFDVLEAFARHPRQILTRDQLLEQVWGYTWEVESNVVDVFVGYLRRKLEADGEARILHTVRGVGFTLRP